jgi:sialic acid synthase SpsE
MKLNTELVFTSDFDWLYFADSEVLFHRVTEQKRFSREGLPENTTTLCFEIACDKGDDVYNTVDEVLATDVFRQLNDLGIARGLTILAHKILRVDELYPKYIKNFELELAKVQSALSRITNLYNNGSSAEFAYQDIQILFAKAIDLTELISNRYAELNQNLRAQYDFGFNTEINIAGRIIGDKYRPYIIAEAGLNHNGSVEMAKVLIAEAKKAGCDAIKFQTFKAEDRVSNAIKHARYFEKTLHMEEDFYEMFKRLEFSSEDFSEIFDYARGLGIEIFSTPFSEEDVDLLEGLGVNCYKVSSFDLVNLKLLKHIASKKKPIILSTGMANLALIEEALEAIASKGDRDVIILHCVSNYPADSENLNLNSILAIKTAFRVPVGYSDHTIGLLAANIAISVGAVVIEKHFTLSNNYEGPDHIISSTPNEMRELVSNSYLIPKILGSGLKRITPGEYDTINKFRKSIFARRQIPQGKVIAKEDVTIKGPGYGLLPRYFDIIIGRPARRTIPADHPITWEDV